MNEVQTIFELRRGKRLEEAYSLARAYWEGHPEDAWGAKALVWVLRDRILACLRAKDAAGAAQLYAEFAAIPIAEDDRILVETAEWLKKNVNDPVRPLLNQAKAATEAGQMDEALAILRDAVRRYPDSVSAREALGWAIFKQLNALGKAEHPDRATVRNGLREYARLFPHPQPGLLHSLILSAATRLAEFIPEFPRFFLWWGPDSFRNEDAQPFRPPDADRDFPSLIEQTIKALHKTCKGLDDPAVKGRCADFLKVWIDRFPHQEWFGYYFGQMLIGAGRQEQARDFLLPIIRKKQNEFWAWAALADTFGPIEEDRLNCLCRAASARVNDESFKVTVHADLAALLAQRGQFAEARHELRAALDIRAAKGWKIPPELATLQAAEWAQGSVSPDGNAALYAERGGRASEILCAGTPWENAVVLDVTEARPAETNGGRKIPALLILGLCTGAQMTTDRVKRNFNAATRTAHPGQPVRIRRTPSEGHSTVMAFEPRAGSDWDIWPERPGVVLSVRPDKAATTVYLGRDELVAFHFDRFADAAGMAIGDWVMVRVAWNEKLARFRGLTLRPVSGRIEVDWAREFSGPVRVMSNGGFGFVEQVFVAPDKLAELQAADGTPIRGMAVLKKKPRQDTQGWAAVTVEICGAPVASTDRPSDEAVFEADVCSAADEAVDGARECLLC